MAEDTQRRRKRKAAVLEGEVQEAENRLSYLDSVLDLPAIVAEFPSLLQLAKESVLKVD